MKRLLISNFDKYRNSSSFMIIKVCYIFFGYRWSMKDEYLNHPTWNFDRYFHKFAGLSANSDWRKQWNSAVISKGTLSYIIVNSNWNCTSGGMRITGLKIGIPRSLIWRTVPTLNALVSCITRRTFLRQFIWILDGKRVVFVLIRGGHNNCFLFTLTRCFDGFWHIRKQRTKQVHWHTRATFTINKSVTILICCLRISVHRYYKIPF